jgi:hypothetical protein
MAPFPQMIGGSYSVQSPITDQEQTVNRYLEIAEVPGATSRAALYPIPGVTAFAESIAVGCRCQFTDDSSGRTFAVQGASFVEIDSVGTVTVRGSVAIDTNPATISTNGDGGGQLLVTSGDKAYCFTLATNVLTEVLASGATMGAVLYGFGLVFDKATGTVFLSDLFDLTTWDPTQFFQRSIGTDPWQAMHVTPYGYIVLPGTQTGETWFNNGGFPIPFAPDPSGQFARGIAATFSIRQLGETVVWLATGIEGDLTIVRQTGFTPGRISTHAVEHALAGYSATSRVDDAIGQVHGWLGHLFYVLTFPTADHTWVFDALLDGKANPWHERGTWISEQDRFTYWRPVFHTFAFGRHLMGDPESAVIYALDADSSTDVDDRSIRWVRRSPAVIAEHKRIVIDALELLFQTGVGTASGQGLSPQVMLRISRDGGITWGSERRLSLGQQGEFWVRVIARMLGMGRSFVFEVSGSDPVPMRLTDAFLKIRPTMDRAA